MSACLYGITMAMEQFDTGTLGQRRPRAGLCLAQVPAPYHCASLLAAPAPAPVRRCLPARVCGLPGPACQAAALWDMWTAVSGWLPTAASHCHPLTLSVGRSLALGLLARQRGRSGTSPYRPMREGWDTS